MPDTFHFTEVFIFMVDSGYKYILILLLTKSTLFLLSFDEQILQIFWLYSAYYCSKPATVA